MKKILLFVGIGVGLIGLTAVGTYVVIAPKILAAGVAAAKQSNPAPPRYELGPTATLATRVVNLADPGANRYLKITIVLAFSPVLDKQSDVTKITAERDTVLQDILTTTLGNQTTQELSTASGKDQLKQSLKTQFAAVLVELHLVDIYFPDFVMQ